MSIARRASARRLKSSRLAPTVRKAAVERQPILPAARAERGTEAGFALIEILCVLAIIGLLAAIILPSVPRATTRAKLESYAVETAAMLKGDRNAALRRQVQIVTLVDAPSRSIRSGSTGRIIRLPDDVQVEAVLASRCADRGARPAQARPAIRRARRPPLADRRRANAALRDSAGRPFCSAYRQFAAAGGRRRRRPAHHRAAGAEGRRMSRRASRGEAGFTL